MNINLRNRICLMVIALAFFVVPRAASAQGSTLTTSRLPVCTEADRLQITSFNVNSTQPKLGETVRAVLKIMNKCPSGTRDLTVEWSIKKSASGSSETVGSGTVTLAPGATSGDLPGNWTAVAGTFTFFGNADPNRKLSETERYNNTTSDVTVTTFEEKSLDYQLARNAGAQFRDNRQSTATDCQFLGQYDANDHSKPYTAYAPGVSFAAWCPRLTGGKADPEVFGGLTLKNGWTIKRVEFKEDQKSNAGWSKLIEPAVGSSNPHTKVHIWANQGGTLTLILTITVRGKAGTSPY